MPLVCVLRSEELPPGELREVSIGETKLLIVHDQDGRWHALNGKCPHAGAPLAKGALCGGRIICPWHKSCFDASSGALLEPPALESLRTYPVTVKGNEILVDSDDAAQTQRAPGSTRTQPRPNATIVVVGGGPGAISAAHHLRALGFAGRLVLVSDEARTPYDRTLLSKMYLSGQAGPEGLPLRPDAFFSDRRIERIHGRVSRLEVASQQVHFDGSQAPLRYDSAVLATGSQPVPLNVPGSEQHVLLLRNVEDANAIIERARLGRHAVLIGSNFIALEAAASLRERGLEVSVVSRDRVPFTKPLGSRLGQVLLDKHLEHGVRFFPQRQAVRVRSLGLKSVLTLDDGQELVADVLVAGIGVQPATDYLRGLTLNGDGGVNVDARMRVSGAENLYAIGDPAAFPLAPENRQTRVEHWRLAQEHGRIAAANLLGLDQPYEGVPYFWTYHYGVRYEFLGHAGQWDHVVIDGDVNGDKPAFISAYLRGDRCVAAFAANRERATAHLFHRFREHGFPTLNMLRETVFTITD